MDKREANARAELADDLHRPGVIKAVRVRSRIVTSRESHLDAMDEAREYFPDAQIEEEAEAGFLVGGRFITFDALLKLRLDPSPPLGSTEG